MKALPLFAAVVLLTACSSESSSGDTTSSAPTTQTTDTTVAPTTAPVTTVPATTTPPTTVPVTTATTVAPTTTPCPVKGDTARKGQPDVLTMSSMVGVDIRVGDHDCYERLVVELTGSGEFPGWGAEYVDDPVRLGESDEFTEIEGSATLLLRMGMWMPAMDEPGGYDGPTQIFPTTVDHILELRQTENFEGITIWAIGLDAEYPFTVVEMSSPARLVIDFQVAEE